MTKRVIELIRVSTEGQAKDDRGGIPAQRAANRRTAAQFGLEIVETVEMIDVSGAAVLFEPDMQKLLRDLGRDDIHGVVAREFSRLMRPDNYGDFAILQRFAETNTLLYLPEGPLNFSDKMGRIVGTMQGLMSGLELSLIRERMMSGKEALRKMGRWAAAQHCLPYGVGYNRDTHTFFYKPESVKVKEVFRRFLAGEHNYDTLAGILGMKSATSARNILQNPIYFGWLVFDSKRDMSRTGRLGPDGLPRRDRRDIKRSPEETYRHKVLDGVVTQGDFDRVQRIIAHKATANLRQRQKLGQFIYNGFLWCSKCGARVHTARNNFDRYYYICSNKKRKNGKGDCLCPYTGHMNRDKTEAILDRLISSTLSNPFLLNRMYAAHLKEIEDSGRKNDYAERQVHLLALQGKRSRIEENFEDGVIDKAKRDAKIKSIDEEIRIAQAALAERPIVPCWNPDMLAKIFAPFSSWNLLNRAEKRRMLNSISPSFQIADYNVRGLYLGERAVPTVGMDAGPEIGKNMSSRSKTAASRSRVPPCR